MAIANNFFTALKTQFARQTIMLMAEWRALSFINVWAMTFGGQILLLMYGLAGRLYVITKKSTNLITPIP